MDYREVDTASEVAGRGRKTAAFDARNGLRYEELSSLDHRVR